MAHFLRFFSAFRLLLAFGGDARAGHGRWQGGGGLAPPLGAPFGRAAERIEDRNAGRLETRYIARYHGEPVLQRCRGDHEIRAVIANSSAQHTPAARRPQVERQHPFAVQRQYPVEPDGKSVRKGRIDRALSRDSAFYFANADDAEEKIRRSLLFKPCDDPRGRVGACATRTA